MNDAAYWFLWTTAAGLSIVVLTAIVWLVTKTSRMQLAMFQDVCETAARNAAYTFIMDRPR